MSNWSKEKTTQLDLYSSTELQLKWTHGSVAKFANFWLFCGWQWTKLRALVPFWKENMSFAEEIAKLFTPSPVFHDPEDVIDGKFHISFVVLPCWGSKDCFHPLTWCYLYYRSKHVRFRVLLCVRGFKGLTVPVTPSRKTLPHPCC